MTTAVVFNARDHSYRLDGVKLPSVTQVLGIKNGKIRAVEYRCPRAVGSSRGRGTTKGDFGMQDQRTTRQRGRSSVAQPCEFCGEDFYPWTAGRSAGRFCSHRCSTNANVVPVWERTAGYLTFGPVSPHRPDLGPCWIWTGLLDRYGYGRISIGQNRIRFAHGVVYAKLIGPLADDHELDHLCRIPSCVNPFHLDPVTHRTNVLRGTGFSAVNAAKTQCIRGHEFNSQNTRTDRDGKRWCRPCHRDGERARRAAR